MNLIDLFLSNWRSETFQLSSPLPPSECLARLKAVTARSPVFLGVTDQPFRGLITGSNAWLMKQRWFQNSWATMASLSVVPQGSGSRIQVKLNVMLGVRIFMLAWFGFLAIWLIGATVAITQQDFEFEWLFPVVGLFMLAMGFVMVTVGRWLSRDDAAFLKTTLEALLKS